MDSRWFRPTDNDEAFITQARVRGECRNMSPELFFPEGPYGDVGEDENGEAWYPLPEALAACDICPLTKDCLSYAQRNDLWGTWGGTSRYQRVQLQRRGRRMVCPICGARAMLVVYSHEVCLACGVSWPAHPVDSPSTS